MAENGFKAVVTTRTIHYPGGPFPIHKRYMNGIVVGQVGHCYVACFNGLVRSTVGMSPVVGALNADMATGWLWPHKALTSFTWDAWSRALRRHGLLDWRQVLARCLVKEPMLKLSIEDYSLDDLATLRDRAWFVGRSLYAPLFRAYALVPVAIWQSGSFPHFEGALRILERFGAIYDPYFHKLVWK